MRNLTGNITYLGSLIGRTFLLSNINNAKNWSGIEENSDGISDYDLLGDDIMLDEILNAFKKDEDFYLILFSMCTKIDLFKTSSGLTVLDSLYFNSEWNYENGFEILLVGDSLESMEIKNSNILIFDSIINGQELLDGILKEKQGRDYSLIEMNNGFYQVRKIKAKITVNDKETSLEGIEFVL